MASQYPDTADEADVVGTTDALGVLQVPKDDDETDVGSGVKKEDDGDEPEPDADGS